MPASTRGRFATRLAACSAPIILCLTPAAANACVPPSVLFEYGSSRLDSGSRAEVASFAEEFRAIRGGKVRLLAQTDGSGANLIMSRRRAATIRAELVRLGVPARAIAIGRGGKSDAVISGPGFARRVVMLVEPAAPPVGAAMESGC